MLHRMVVISRRVYIGNSAGQRKIKNLLVSHSAAALRLRGFAAHCTNKMVRRVDGARKIQVPNDYPRGAAGQGPPLTASYLRLPANSHKHQKLSQARIGRDLELNHHSGIKKPLKTVILWGVSRNRIFLSQYSPMVDVLALHPPSRVESRVTLKAPLRSRSANKLRHSSQCRSLLYAIHMAYGAPDGIHWHIMGDS